MNLFQGYFQGIAQFFNSKTKEVYACIDVRAEIRQNSTSGGQSGGPDHQSGAPDQHSTGQSGGFNPSSSGGSGGFGIGK